jgi:uncharacterized protein YkwD
MVLWALVRGRRPKLDREQRGSPLIRRSISLIALFGALILAIPIGVVAQQSANPEQRMAVLVNQARIAAGLNPVAISKELTAAAVAHTRDMVKHGYMEHEGRDGSTPQDRAVRSGYTVPSSSAWIVVEVISARPTAEGAVNWLLSDRLHRGVMLRPTWREMGISYVEGGPYGQLWTIDFGCRPNVLPVIADTTPSGGVTLRLTNEECSPTGGNSEQMGKASQVMVSDRSDFNGATWEPFVSTKVVSGNGKNVFVKLRDERGREIVNAVNPSGSNLVAASTGKAVTIPSSPPGGATPTKVDNQKVQSNENSSNENSSDDEESADPVVKTTLKGVFDGP